MKITIEKILIIALSFLAVLLFFRKCQNDRNFDSFREESELRFKENNAKLLDSENRIYQGDLIITENNKMIENLIDSIKYMKDIKSKIRVVTDTKIDSIEIPFDVPYRIDPDLSSYIQVPISFDKQTEWYSISGEIRRNGLFFDSISYKNDFSIITGKIDHGSFIKNLFKTNETTITIKDNNPYSETTTLQQVLIKERKKNWGIGPQASVLLVDGEIRYSIGFGVTYSIIKF